MLRDDPTFTLFKASVRHSFTGLTRSYSSKLKTTEKRDILTNVRV